MKYDLAAMARRVRSRRKPISIRPIMPTEALAADLYAAAYKPVIMQLSASVERILAAYGRSITDGGRFNDADNSDEVETLGEALRRLVLLLTPGLRSWAVRVERFHRNKWRGAVLTAAGVDLATILMGSGTPISVQEAIDWNTSLISSVSDEARGRISNLVFSAFRARQPVAELARDLREAVAMSRRRALGIASDQVKKLSAALDQERQTDAGIEEYTWRHSMKRHPRKIHQARDGDEFRWDKPPADGPPGALPYCGCRAQALIRFD